MKIDTKDHMVSIPLKQYNDIVSQLESQDHLARKFQDVIYDIGNFFLNRNGYKMESHNMKEILLKHGIELYVSTLMGESKLSVRMIKKEE